MVGQRYATMLSGHPFFKLTTLTGNSSVGKIYRDAVHWVDHNPIPDEVANMEIVSTNPNNVDADLVFSPLPSDAARTIEPMFADAGIPVISEASTYRMDSDVPLIVPEVNPDHLEIISTQKRNYNREGFIVTGPNCTTSGLVMVLKPLYENLGVKRAIVTTMQALSGAGYQGVPSLSIIDNVIPYIKNEEEKIASETLKMLGTRNNETIEEGSLGVSATCNRVPTIDGHLETLYLESDKEIPIESAREALSSFKGIPQELKLPTAPREPIIICNEVDRPQPRLDRLAGSIPGMSVVVGRIREGLDNKSLRLTLLTHNTIRGAAGNAILIAELLVAKGMIGSR